MRVEQEQQATTQAIWIRWLGIIRTAKEKHIRLERSGRTHGACTTCTGMCGSGAATDIVVQRIKRECRLIHKVLVMARIGCVVAGDGLTDRHGVAQRIEEVFF